MLKWFQPKFNVENILPEIEEMLRQFDYQGLTDKDNPINAIALEIMSDGARSSQRFINIYQFKVEGQQFYICDKAFGVGMEAPVHMCMLATGKSFPLGFELVDDDYYFINNDCKTLEEMDKWKIRAEGRDAYEEHKGLLMSILSSLEQFATEEGPISFFSFPRDKIIGYHVNTRRLDAKEIAVIASLIRRFP